MWYLKELGTNKIIAKSKSFSEVYAQRKQEYFIEEVIDHGKELKAYLGELDE